MMDYLKKKLEALLDSLLEPLWKRVMAASTGAKLAILVSCGAIVGAVAYPAIPVTLYRQGSAITRTAFRGEPEIPLSKESSEKTRAAKKRLSQTIQGDLLKLTRGRQTPWSAAQTVVALGGTERVIRQREAIISFIRSNSVPGCACWTELPENTAGPQCPFISGWVMTAFAEMKTPATSEELKYLLATQDEEGWWPTYHIGVPAEYASTYSTAWAVIGLHSQRSKNLINKQDADAVDKAITKATGWLLSQRSKGARWKAYPRLSTSTESESISGAVLHALHLVAPEEVVGLDKEWLDNLPQKPVAVSEGENYYVETRGTGQTAIDHFVQIKMPWMLVATSDAYRNGDVLQRAKALQWMEETLKHRSVAIADADERNWWRAELLYGLRYVMN